MREEDMTLYQCDLFGILVTLNLAGKQILFIEINRDGCVKRMGTGTKNNSSTTLCIGHSLKEFFDQLIVDFDSIAQWIGTYSAPSQLGRKGDRHEWH